MKILHLINDHQVIERTLGVYEKVFPGCNDILIFTSNQPLKYIKNHINAQVVNSKNLKKIGRSFNFNGYAYIIAHFMSRDKIDFIKYVPKDIPVCWEVYGWDLYNQFLEPLGYKLYYSDPDSYRDYYFFKKHFRFLFECALWLKGYRTNYFKWSVKNRFRYITNRINSIQYCCSYDAKYIEEYAGKTIPSYEVFNYTLSDVLGDLEGASFSVGSNIMVGNSASFSNNHLYVLNYLKDICIDKQTNIIIPMSYGGSPRYVEDVEKNYNESFPKQIIVLKQYLPIHEYNKLFLSLRCAIFSAWRQESIGNIIMCLYMGIRVFMSKQSPLYKYLKECGFILFELENATEDLIRTALSDEIKINNRRLVENHYNDKRFEETYRSLIQ